MTDEQKAADELLKSREAVYGNRPDNMRRTAMIWSGLTGYDIQPWMVPLMMSAYKMFRAFGAPDYSDNIDDMDGWNKMFREQMEADGTPIIQARTVEEYEKAKALGRTMSAEEIRQRRDAWDRRKAELFPEGGPEPALSPVPDQSEGEAIASFQERMDWLRNRCGQQSGATPSAYCIGNVHGSELPHQFMTYRQWHHERFADSGVGGDPDGDAG